MPAAATPVSDVDQRRKALAAAATVVDPEVPVLSIADLGVLRDVAFEGETVVATITPTYSGCPAMSLIALEVDLALEKAGFRQRRVDLKLAPAWTTDWMSAEGREKLRAYGIAPPAERGSGRGALFGVDEIACPKCGSSNTERLAEFGSTACKALWRCKACKEPFDHFKCL